LPRSFAQELAQLIEDAPELELTIEAAVQNDGRVFLTSTRLREGVVLRACVLHYDTSSADLRKLVEVVREIGRDLARRHVMGSRPA
jgi:hypothetical protein